MFTSISGLILWQKVNAFDTCLNQRVPTLQNCEAEFRYLYHMLREWLCNFDVTNNLTDTHLSMKRNLYLKVWELCLPWLCWKDTSVCQRAICPPPRKKNPELTGLCRSVLSPKLVLYVSLCCFSSPSCCGVVVFSRLLSCVERTLFDVPAASEELSSFESFLTHVCVFCAFIL